jgi:hypothetical protein
MIQPAELPRLDHKMCGFDGKEKPQRGNGSPAAVNMAVIAWGSA